MSFVLPLDDFMCQFDPSSLSHNVMVVTTIGKVDSTLERPYAEILTSKHRPENHNAFYIEGKYSTDEKALYLTLHGPWNTHDFVSTLSRLERDSSEMGFLQTWNMYTNLNVRALLFVFTMSHIIVIYHPSHSPDVSVIQLLRLLSHMWPKYQALQIAVLTRCIDSRGREDTWPFHGRFCSPRLLFTFSCPPAIRALATDPGHNREDIMRRIHKLERAIEDQIYMSLRKSRNFKAANNRAFYSIASNEKFVFVEAPFERCLNPMDKLMRDMCAGFHIPDDSDSENEETVSISPGIEGNPILTVKERTLQDSIQEQVKSAHNDGFNDHTRSHTKTLQLPSLQMWFEAANVILHDAEIGLGDVLSVFPLNTDALGNPDPRLLGDPLVGSVSLAAAIYHDNRPSPQQVQPYQMRLGMGAYVAKTRQDRRDERKRLQMHRRRGKRGSPDRLDSRVVRK